MFVVEGLIDTVADSARCNRFYCYFAAQFGPIAMQHIYAFRVDVLRIDRRVGLVECMPLDEVNAGLEMTTGSRLNLTRPSPTT